MNDGLQAMLRDALEAGTASNGALAALVDDYARYHAVLAVVAGAFLVVMIVLTVFFWRHLRRAARATPGRWTFEKGTYLLFGFVTAVVGIFLLLIVAANVSTALNPEPGFEGSLGMISSDPSPQAARRYDSYASWVESGAAQPTAGVQAAVDQRLAWQRPKAIICTLLLVLVAALSAMLWRHLIRRSRDPESTWRVRDIASVVLGVAAVGACLLLMLMVMGNTQAALAPTAMTLFFG